jgi:transcriptional regulator with XRE-family HTH domain
MKIGEKIRMIREIKGISQEAIATHLDISPQAYG